MSQDIIKLVKEYEGVDLSVDLFKAVISRSHSPSTLDMILAPHLDKLMGVDSTVVAKIELELASTEGLKFVYDAGAEQIGIGKDPVGLWSPYSILHFLFHSNIRFAPGALVCDVGAGIGRLGLYLKAFQPEVNYIGMEIVPYRAAAARDGDLFVHTQDVTKVGVPVADAYYFYNALPPIAYKRFITDLAAYKAKGNKFYVVAPYDPLGGLATILDPLGSFNNHYIPDVPIVIYGANAEEIKS